MAVDLIKVKDFAQLAVTNFTHRKTRTLLTLVGIFIGIAAVIALISIGQGLQGAINSEFARIGADKLLLVRGQAGAGPNALYSSVVLDDSDADTFKRVSGVSLVSPVIFKMAQSKFDEQAKSIALFGFPVDQSKTAALEFYDISPVEGSYLPRGGGAKAVIGNSVAYGKFFKKPVHVGDSITLNGKEFKVVGINKKVGNPNIDNGIVIPLDEAKELFNEKSYYGIIGKLDPGVKPKDLVEKVKEAVRRHRQLKAGKEDFAVQTSEQIIQSFNNIFSVVQAIVIGIAAISLLVGGVGIMNTMYTSVVERTKEIGIMKAIGARNSDILLIFILESGLLGLAGGILGCIFGMLLAKLVEFGAQSALGSNLLRADFPLELLIGALLFSFFIGMASGVLPARQAAMQKPIDAIRTE